MSKAILNQHIFRLGVDKRTENYNQKWFDEIVVPTFNADKNGGYLPTVHIGHNDGTTEKPRVAFMDNIRRVDNDVFCDMTEIPDVLAPELQANLWPNRSVEIRADGKGFASTALLGGTEPHFKLAQSNQLVENHFKALPAQSGEPTIIKFEAAEMSLSDAIEVQDKNDDAWKVDSALWSKLWDIKNSETMTPEEKKTEIDKALAEYVGMQATIQKEIVDITDTSGGSTTDTNTDTSQFKALADQRAQMESQFAAREAALVERENELLENDLKSDGFAGPVAKNFLALRKHLPNETKNIQFKAGDKTEEVTPRTAFERFMRDMARRFKAGTLFAETDPINAGNLDDVTRGQFSADQINAEENKLIEKYQADNNIKTYGDARRAWLTTEEGQKFKAVSAAPTA